jgi:regulator of protease activity HflC (stomatin/prohibitin superfamily)
MAVNPIFLVLLFFVLFIVFLAVKGFKVVQQAETMVIERLGRYNRTLDSGINIIWPIVEKPRRIHWRFTKPAADGRQVSLTKETVKIDLRETVYDFPSQNAITKDNVGLQIDALLYFQVLDPVRAVYEVANLPEAMEKLTKTTLRNVVGELDLDECLASRDTINNRLTSILDEASDKWGVKVTRVELQDLNPPEDVRQAMEKQMRAERDRRAAILEAEGKKQAAILEAQGSKEAAITTAEGEAEARIKKAKAEAEAVVKVTDAVKGSGGDPINYLVAVRYIEALTQMVSGKDNKVVYIPYEATSVLSSLGGIKDLFQIK